EGRGVEGGEDLRTRRMDAYARRAALAQELRQRAHVLTFEPVAHPRLPRGFQPHALAAHASGSGCDAMRARRSWNSALVASRRSSIGLSTRSLAPWRSRVAWLARLSSPVITSTGRRRLP